MDTGQFRKIKAIVQGALALPVDERRDFVERECVDDPVVYDEVARLLSQPDAEEDDLSGVRLRIAEAVEIETAASPGDAEGRVGPYVLLTKIGEGGMGEVWAAEQRSPVRRRVALKVIKRGMDSAAVLARFEAERQALAMMEHPAIARVYEAGITSDGRPYFAMEFIDGLPITRFCDEQRLTTRERLDLFRRVCEGVQHAHQKAVIHRDLKPSNILVAYRDKTPEPRIIDFGVAKATAHRLSEKTMVTALGEMIGTPEYMSPEQADLSGRDIDTRTDVYALGVLLYELLTGELPFDPADLRRAGFDEMRRRIRESVPPRPSERVGRAAVRSTTAAELRRCEPRTLSRQIRGDLDWITMKALEKERRRRYASPAELAMDVARFLSDEPVEAGPPSASYRMGKFFRRHRLGVCTGAVALIALIAFTSLISVQARRIAAERDRANRQAEIARRTEEFLVGVFEVSAPSESRGNRVTAVALLDQASRAIARDRDATPEVREHLIETVRLAYGELGIERTAEEVAGAE